MPRHKHDWQWESRRFDLFGKAIDTYRCSICLQTEERKA
jgi:hypothetical protein